MTARLPEPDDDRGQPDHPESSGGRGADHPGNLQPLRPGSLIVAAALALVPGWLIRPVGHQLFGSAPLVGWVMVVAVWFLAAVVAGAAVVTWRLLQVRGVRLPHHQAVNRLLVAQASALGGAIVAGGYLGYAVSWLGVDTEFGTQRLVRSLIAAMGGVALAVAALQLQRACRVRSEQDEA